MAFGQDSRDKIGESEADRGRGKKRSVEGGSDAVETGALGSKHLSKKEGILQKLKEGSAGRVGSHAEEESSLQPETGEDGEEAGHAGLHAPVGVNIDLQTEDFLSSQGVQDGSFSPSHYPFSLRPARVLSGLKVP